MDNYNYNCRNNTNNWRKQKEEKFNQMGTGSKPRSFNNNNNNNNNSRNPSFGGQPSSWEMNFCASAGVSWEKVLDTKRYMFNDEKILKWSDSAVEEAFLNAKKRYWAKMHGQPCDIELPDPNIFIDNVDWMTKIDTVLMSDLENRESYENEKQGGGVILGIPVVPEQYLLSPTGWGDAEEAKPQQPLIRNCEPQDYGNGNGQSGEYGKYANEEGERRTCSGGWNDGYKSYVYVTKSKANVGQNKDNGSTTWYGYNNKKQWDHGHNNNNNKKWDHGANNTSRYKISRYQQNGNHQSMVDDDGNKRGNLGYERPLNRWRPVAKRW